MEIKETQRSESDYLAARLLQGKRSATANAKKYLQSQPDRQSTLENKT